MDITFNNEGLIPAIIQDQETNKVLMLSYMNKASLKQTIETKKVTFFSRKKERLWIKGETSGNFLKLVSVSNDCDNDALLVKVNPMGPTCHKGTDTCWRESNIQEFGNINIFLANNIESLDGLENVMITNNVNISSNIGLLDFCALQNLIVNGSFNDITISGNAFDPTIQDIIDGNCSN